MDAGIPNRERVYIQVLGSTNLRHWALIACAQLQSGAIIPLHNYLFWPGSMDVDPPCVIVVYTGPGETKITTLLDSKTPAVVLHWGQPKTVFTRDGMFKPALFAFANFQI
jgi:hypothetical protein